MASASTERRRVVAATTIGTAIEWYEFFLYAAVAGLVFNQLMFGPLGPGAATVVSFLTVGLSFLFRPLGAFLAGHYADKLGRRVVLMVTLFAMGGATTLIGLVPSFEAIGVWAPVLLILLRIVQGISAGGEWGSAVLLAVEHAPRTKRGLYGAGPQVGAPAGLLMANGALALMNWLAPGDAFMVWGWRVPFLFSIVLVLIGFLVRIGVDESPVYTEMAQDRAARRVPANPIGTLFTRHFSLVVAGALLFAANGVAGYMMAGGYIQSYTTGPLGLERGPVLLIVTASAAVWIVSTVVAGAWSDRIGRRNMFLLGFVVQALGVVVLFPMVNSGDYLRIFAALAFLSVGLGLTYGQTSATYAELFPASVRGSGVSITYAIGSILGGAFAPMIAAWLVEATGSTAGVTAYLLVASAVGFVTAALLRDRTGIPLGHDEEKRQAQGHFVFAR
ncbi:MFS transporter [Corynebacterium pilosum]|uniref:Proline/betaine transporter n=1 Tax=Corynebacterium pilosum TaxID=35756 RepID=A0A376CNH3_9CORY|nr:MFS transporter [Corynebacterium pilosum]STC70041.1 proline/betaine transporter [Corynebacterium pilosum]